jgi:hypothetical protein
LLVAKIGRLILPGAKVEFMFESNISGATCLYNVIVSSFT